LVVVRGDESASVSPAREGFDTPTQATCLNGLRFTAPQKADQARGSDSEQDRHGGAPWRMRASPTNKADKLNQSSVLVLIASTPYHRGRLLPSHNLFSSHHIFSSEEPLIVVSATSHRKNLRRLAATVHAIKISAGQPSDLVHSGFFVPLRMRRRISWS